MPCDSGSPDQVFKIAKAKSDPWRNGNQFLIQFISETLRSSSHSAYLGLDDWNGCNELSFTTRCYRDLNIISSNVEVSFKRFERGKIRDFQVKFFSKHSLLEEL